MKLRYILLLAIIISGVYIYVYPHSSLAGKAKNTFTSLKGQLFKSSEVKSQQHLITNAEITFADEQGKAYTKGALKVSVTPSLASALSLSIALQANTTDLNDDIQATRSNLSTLLNAPLTSMQNKVDDIGTQIESSNINAALLNLDEISIDAKRIEQTIETAPVNQNLGVDEKNTMIGRADKVTEAIASLHNELVKVNQGGFSGYINRDGAILLSTVYTYRPYNLVIQQGIGMSKIYPLNTTIEFTTRVAKVMVERRAILLPLVVWMNTSVELGNHIVENAGQPYLFTVQLRAQQGGTVKQPYVEFIGNISTFSTWVWVYSDNGLGVPQSWANGHRIHLGERYLLPHAISSSTYATYAIQVQRESQGNVKLCVSDETGLDKQCALFSFE